MIGVVITIIKMFKRLFICEDNFTYSSGLDASSVVAILASKGFPVYKKIMITKEKFEIYIRSSTSVVPPKVSGEIFSFNNGTKVNLKISQNKKIKIVFYLIYGFIAVVLVLITLMFFFDVGTLNSENIEGFLLTLSLIIFASIVVPKVIYIYERNKVIALLSSSLKLHRQ